RRARSRSPRSPPPRACSWRRSPATGCARSPAWPGRACSGPRAARPPSRRRPPCRKHPRSGLPGTLGAVPGPGPVSVLSDGAILRLVEEGRIKIEPWDAQRVQPASVDLRLGDSFRVFHNHRTTAIDLRDPPLNLTEEVVVQQGDPSVIHPGEFVL